MSYWSRSGLKVRLGRFSISVRILITGGFGFVGGRLAVHLARAGHQIILGTRHSLTHPEWLIQAEVAKIAWNDEAALKHCCKGVDVIIHASGMNAQACAADPVAALSFNGLATAKFVAAASRASVKKFIYLSTAHVYASPLVGTITEESCPRNLHPYATSHLAGEQSVLSASDRGELQGIVLRLSNAFGAPMHKDVNCWMLLVNDLCKQAVETRKLVLQSSGLQHRDFISLTEVCLVLEKLVYSDQLKQANVFNVGAGVSQSVLEMAKLIQLHCNMVLGFEPELHHKQSGVVEQPLTLTYRTDNLNTLGISCKSQTDTVEIDNLLQFCQTSFNQTRSA
jgi:UDP-glucose 4-epimerase